MTALTKAEVTAKCTAALVASRDELAMSKVINVGRTTTAKVPVLDVKAYLHQNNLWTPIRKAQNDATKSPAGQASAAALVDFASSGVLMMDVALPIVGAQLGYLVTDAVISQANKDAIIAMGTVPDPVTPFDVANVMQGA
jgi:hypothetical protein